MSQKQTMFNNTVFHNWIELSADTKQKQYVRGCEGYSIMCAVLLKKRFQAARKKGVQYSFKWTDPLLFGAWLRLTALSSMHVVGGQLAQRNVSVIPSIAEPTWFMQYMKAGPRRRTGAVCEASAKVGENVHHFPGFVVETKWNAFQLKNLHIKHQM